MRSRIAAHVGEPIAHDCISQFESPEALALHLRLKTFLTPTLNERDATAAETLRPGAQEPIAPEMPADCLTQEIARLAPESRLLAQGEMAVYLADAAAIPHTLSEIGRLRELTLRSAGEGTGRPRDLDRFDASYEHLFIWHTAQRQIVGAYRLGRVDVLRRRFGRSGLYTGSLFNFRDPFFLMLGPALELGRCFVRPEYQRSFAPLTLLWKGIAELIARHPRYSRLIGPVSLGGSYRETSRNLLVDFLRSQHFDQRFGRLVSARHPVPRSPAMRSLTGELAMLGALEPLAALVEDLEPDGKGVPVLLRHYLKLGGRVLGFNLHAGLAPSIDCLLLVDLHDTDPRELRRYMGAQAVARFNRRRLVAPASQGDRAA